MSKFLNISENESKDNVTETPLEPDDNLLESTVSSLFPGCSGIRYKDTRTGEWTYVKKENGIYRPPDNGWCEIVYTAQFSTKTDASEEIDQVRKRKANASKEETQVSPKIRRQEEQHYDLVHKDTPVSEKRDVETARETVEEVNLEKTDELTRPRPSLNGDRYGKPPEDQIVSDASIEEESNRSTKEIDRQFKCRFEDIVRGAKQKVNQTMLTVERAIEIMDQEILLDKVMFLIFVYRDENGIEIGNLSELMNIHFQSEEEITVDSIRCTLMYGIKRKKIVKIS